MRSRSASFATCSWLVFTTFTVLGAFTIGSVIAPRKAQAAFGLYAQVGLGYGQFGGSELVTEDDKSRSDDFPIEAGADGCCAKGGVAFQVRAGYVLFGFLAPEFGIVGNAWDIGSNIGGGGFVGGGLRLFPIGLFQALDMDVGSFPIDIGLGAMLAWSLVGKEFAYTGRAVVLDAFAEIKLSEMLSAGLKVDIGLPTYSDFVFTDYNNSVGRCLDTDGSQSPRNALAVPGGKDSLICNGRGPKATFVSPQLIVTFHFDILNEGA